MRYAVITGTSRGLGQSIAMLLIKQGIHVIGVARNKNVELEKVASEYAVTYHHETCDLSNIDQVKAVFESITEQVFTQQAELVYLVNNAGMVAPIDTTDHHTFEELTDHVHVNLLSPMATTAQFLTKSSKDTPVVIANVTSGAADRSVYGWSAYCSTKAGLNRYTETVAMEQDELNTDNKVILFNPGIMDTNMQGEIRSSSEQAFKDVETFKQYKEDNSLRDSDLVANKLVDVLIKHQEITNGKNYNIKDLL
ncbi:(S)-benzoin forming benzil reductase [Aquibacillus rhizosphaerae]|uniref:(S)-benzoin forming benzil reductase n=1 Tax=Aquibacillus rhizosphaerae TaxID=3051431 RepID=A0ABT7LA18_9BACI|nr:(S)-benzoin forming benzil reductase [Aquibacillus sp. LR5S19]MDL4842716.1 (S)-benzoin forming benzil reductase [Aquibacillus sp. LR5S19]